MTEIDERLRQIERNPSPDLWEEISTRRPRTESERGHRVLAASVAALIAVVAIGFLFVAFAPWRSDPPVAGSSEDGRVEYRIDHLGVTVEHPVDWHVQPLNEQVGHTTMAGAVISNRDRDLEHPDLGDNGVTSEWDLSDLPPQGVVVSIERIEQLPIDTERPDSEFPLSLDDAQALDPTQHPGATDGLWLPFRFRGGSMGARVYFGPEASAEDRRAAEDIVASIRPTTFTAQEFLDGTAPLGEELANALGLTLEASFDGDCAAYAEIAEDGVGYCLEGITTNTVDLLAIAKALQGVRIDQEALDRIERLASPSLGGEVQTPDVIGLSEFQARAMLEGIGLQVEVEYERTDEFPQETVTGQAPPPGEPVAPGDVVDLTVARGP